MESETFRTRVANLLQKSRKAIRLYSAASGGPMKGGPVKGQDPVAAEHTQAQVDEWRGINAELLRRLSVSFDAPQHHRRKLASDVCRLRVEYLSEARRTADRLEQLKSELLSSGEKGDFIRAATVATELVRLKARVQACEAVHHELDTLVKRSRVTEPVIAELLANEESTIELESSSIVVETPDGPGKVIHLRRRG